MLKFAKNFKTMSYHCGVYGSNVCKANKWL